MSLCFSFNSLKMYVYKIYKKCDIHTSKALSSKKKKKTSKALLLLSVYIIYN